MLFSAERKRGYQMSLLKHGITPREEDCVEIDALNDAYEETLKALFTAPDRITSPQLTTVDVNPYQLGMEAASQTINHIEHPNLLATKIIVPHKLIQRESCCPPPEI